MNKLWMEDVRGIALKSYQVIEEELKKFNITLTIEQSDSIYNLIWKELEKLSNGDYRSMN
jgi:hypothetical protein